MSGSEQDEMDKRLNEMLLLEISLDFVTKTVWARGFNEFVTIYFIQRYTTLLYTAGPRP